jgi:hypothetical protein
MNLSNCYQDRGRAGRDLGARDRVVDAVHAQRKTLFLDSTSSSKMQEWRDGRDSNRR